MGSWSVTTRKKQSPWHLSARSCTRPPSSEQTCAPQRATHERTGQVEPVGLACSYVPLQHCFWLVDFVRFFRLLFLWRKESSAFLPLLHPPLRCCHCCVTRCSSASCFPIAIPAIKLLDVHSSILHHVRTTTRSGHMRTMYHTTNRPH